MNAKNDVSIQDGSQLIAEVLIKFFEKNILSDSRYHIIGQYTRKIEKFARFLQKVL